MCAKERKVTKEPQDETTQGAKKKGPMHEMRMANVRASFWDNGDWCSVTFSRLYLPKDKEKGWDSTPSLRRTDMGNLALLAHKAEAWMEQWMASRIDTDSNSVVASE